MDRAEEREEREGGGAEEEGEDGEEREEGKEGEGGKEGEWSGCRVERSEGGSDAWLLRSFSCVCWFCNG